MDNTESDLLRQAYINEYKLLTSSEYFIMELKMESPTGHRNIQSWPEAIFNVFRAE